MKFANRYRTGLIGGATAAVVLSVGSVAIAAIPEATGAYTGCYATKDGSLRVIDLSSGQKCTSRERQISWNERGVSGEAGPAGPQGPAGEDGSVTLAAAVSPGDVTGLRQAELTDGESTGVTLHTMSFDVPAAAFYDVKSTYSVRGSQPVMCGEEQFPSYEGGAVTVTVDGAPVGAKDLWLEPGRHDVSLVFAPLACHMEPLDAGTADVVNIHLAAYRYSSAQ